jgi:16S rRNA G966 N2-methylase RsmD
MVYEPVMKAGIGNQTFDYTTCRLLSEIKVDKQSAKRHFGVHGYFTKQAWNVVQEYIKNFSKAGDLIFDPFGGSGVTAIEAMMTDRRAVHLDLNPMSTFIVENLCVPTDMTTLGEAFQRIKTNFQKHRPENTDEIEKALQKYPYPKGFRLPKASDVETIEQLFSPKQLAQLAYLKYLIKREKDLSVRKTLMLMFSGLLNKVNLTYHSSEGRSEGRGNSSIFQYYRYRIAPEPAFIEILPYFESRLNKVKNAKLEILGKINANTIHNLQIVKGTATKVFFLPNESVDYIYTDPPYGNKIPYLDLSTMWNAWLDLEVTEQDFKEEAIEGGEHHKSKDEYNNLIAESIQEMYRVLKFDRWMSFVFAHKDPEFWHLIIDTAERAGFEYAGAVKQANGQTSFKKRQHPFTVLSGQLIINFRKVRRPRAIMKANLGMNITEVIVQTVEGIIAKDNGATIEQINDELIIKGLELGFLDLLKKEYSDLTPLLMDMFDYDEKNEKFLIRKNTKFQSHIDVQLRIRYYLISYLRRMEIERKAAHFDDIILHIIPLLKNGNTPDKQTILRVLEDVGERVGKDSWQLRKGGQLSLFL